MPSSTGSDVPQYRIRAVVCYTGAHYFSYVRKKAGGGSGDEWRVYNDT